MRLSTKPRQRGIVFKTVPIVVLLLATGIFLSLLTPVAGSLSDNTAIQELGDSDIREELTVEEDNVDVLIHFEEYRDVTKSNSQVNVDSLKSHSAETQQPAVDFAKRTEGVTVEERFWLSNMILVSVDTDKASVDNLEDIENVESLTGNFELSLNNPQTRSISDESSYKSDKQSRSNTQYDTTYGVDQVNATSVWDEYGTQGFGSLVTVLDTGVDPDHPDIDLNKWAEFDEEGNRVGSNPFDMESHGTHVSGTVSGGNSSGTYIGVAPNVTLNHGKVFQSDGLASFSALVSGMEWAVESNSDVVSMSLGAQGYYDAYIDPVRNAEDSGTLVVASIGNTGEGTSSGPGNVYDTTSVGATNAFEDVVGFSSGEVINTDDDWFSPPKDWPAEYTVPTVSAPGYIVNSSVPGGEYRPKSGTSMAAPHVSGVVALIESKAKDELRPSFINELLESTAYKPNSSNEGERDTRYGSGIVDAYKAVQALENPIEIQKVDPTTDKAYPTENLTFVYTLNNQIAKSEDESSVNLIIGGVVEDSDENITVSPNGQVTGKLTFTDVDSYGPGDTISYTVELEDNDDNVSGQLDVKEVDNFDVSIQDVNTPREAVDELEVEVDVRNSGNIDGNQDIHLNTPIGNSVYEDLNVSAGERKTVNLSIETELGDTGTYPATVRSDDDFDNTNFTVKQSKIFHVKVVDKVSPVEGEGNISLSVRVTNTKDSRETQQIQTTVLSGAKENVTLAPDETKTIDLTVPTEVGDAGTYKSRVRSQDYSTSYETEVNLPRLGTDFPSDPDNDGLYEDVDGDGRYTIFDIQVFFENLGETEIRDHEHAYKFSRNNYINIIDVQALFDEL